MHILTGILSLHVNNSTSPVDLEFVSFRTDAETGRADNATLVVGWTGVISGALGT